jgi:GNAT superfamily N-acetyltransferase
MSEFLTRNPRTDEVPLLKDLWSSVFGNIGIDAFFRLFYKPELCAVVEMNGSLAAMGYLIPSGDIVSGATGTEQKKAAKCAMVYSVGTLEECRGLGLGTIIVNSLINLAGDLGYDAVVLCPSDDGLFEYYNNRTDLRDWFYVSESIYTNLPAGTPSVKPIEISIDEYLSVREKQLTDIMHIKQNEKLFKYQLVLCSELGGGLFRIGDCFAVVERQSDAVVWVKELLISGKGNTFCNGRPDDIDFTKMLAPLAHMFPADEYIIRTPAKNGAGRRFGMLSFCGNILNLSVKNNIAPWYGMAFD